MHILYFNPETEYALATGASFYTSPSIVEEMRRKHQLLPATFASDNDVILVDDVSDFKHIGGNLIDWNCLADFCITHPDAIISPWGWNLALRHRMLDEGVPESMLPSTDFIVDLRDLAHRRYTVTLNTEWNLLVPDENVDIPKELFCEEECVSFWYCNPGCWMKAPWSSSGRGVINTAADMEERHIRPWCRGIIRRQGSVLAESPADKIADFASEWWIDSNGSGRYLGISMFETSNRGKYLSNSNDSQESLVERFDSLCRIPIDFVISTQKKIIEKVYARYSGPLGIDMIICRDGSLRPFVEVNLRMTMGMVELNRFLPD